jgi:hypothetical protein
MGSYCELSFDDISILSAKSAVPDNLVAIFQESDRVVREVPETEEEDARKDILYQAPREFILNRLNLIGYTEIIVQERFAEWRTDQIESWTDYYAAYPEDFDKETLKALEGFEFAVWRQRASDLLQRQWNLGTTEPADEIERRMRDHDDGWLHFDGYGSLVTLRALLDALPNVKQLTLDVTDLIHNGWIDETESICSRRRETDHGEVRNLAPTVILAEGSSDIEIMQNSLAALYPELRDYFSFFDHRELNVDGGTSYLVKFLKAFAAARAPLQIIAVFDNDVAGVQACKQALALDLPRNIRVMTLPDIKLAEKYPTVGPQGEGTANVNGRAASIELYLGRASLVDAGGNLRPVRWTGYVPPFNAYQGEVEGKADIRASFLRGIKSVAHTKAARNTYPELASVWEAIFRTMEQSMSEARRNETREILK